LNKVCRVLAPGLSVFFTGKPRAKTWRLWARLLTGKKDTRKREEMKENDAAD
jgi:hypothetical protein